MHDHRQTSGLPLERVKSHIDGNPLFIGKLGERDANPNPTHHQPESLLFAHRRPRSEEGHHMGVDPNRRRSTGTDRSIQRPTIALRPRGGAL